MIFQHGCYSAYAKILLLIISSMYSLDFAYNNNGRDDYK